MNSVAGVLLGLGYLSTPCIITPKARVAILPFRCANYLAMLQFSGFTVRVTVRVSNDCGSYFEHPQS